MTDAASRYAGDPDPDSSIARCFESCDCIVSVNTSKCNLYNTIYKHDVSYIGLLMCEVPLFLLYKCHAVVSRINCGLTRGSLTDL